VSIWTGDKDRAWENSEHYLKETWFFDVRASYRFLMSSAPEAVAGYAKDTSSSGKQRQPEGIAPAQMANCNWQRILNDTTITLGCNNVFGHDPPTAKGLENYPTSSTILPVASFTSV
jgi:hypothetical protein